MSNTSNRFDISSLKKVADWCVKRKKFFVAAVLFVCLSVMLHSCTGQPASDSNGVNGTEISTETENLAESFIVADDFNQDKIPELNDLINKYFTAYAANDVDTLSKIATPMTDNEKHYIEVFSEYIEGYENVSCYSKPGPEDNSYMVSVYFDMKFKDVDTLAPGLDFFYVNTDAEGGLYINNLYSPYNMNRTENELDPSIYAIILKFEQQEDAVALREKVQSAYETAVSSDVNLATMISTTIPDAMKNWMTDVNAASEQQVEDTQTTESTEATESTETADADNTDTAATDDATTDNAAADTATTDNAAADDATTDNAATDDTAADTAEQKPASDKVKVTADSVNIRKTASTDGTFVAEAKKGDVFKKLGTEGDWTKIKYDDQDGYIKTEFLSAE